MQIDGNEVQKNATDAFNRGDKAEAYLLQDEFVDMLHHSLEANEDHCNCTKKGCKYHGKCLECVAIHRAHREHLPYCMQSMVNEKLMSLSALTEHSLCKEL